MQLSHSADDMQHPYRKAFLSAAVLFLLSMLPLLIPSHGKYLFAGDYNVQSITFLQHLSWLIHGEGLPQFDWHSGLGADFLNSYSGYLSPPFSLVLMLLPTAALPYGLTLMNALKMGIAAVTAALWCRQYVQKNRTAYLCGMLYAFSGFQLFNLVNPFLNSICLFPLLLYSFDKLVLERKRFCFALMLFLEGIMDALILFAICIFIMLYYIVRVASGSFPKPGVGDFFGLAVESLAGVLLLGFGIVPFWLAMQSNARASTVISPSDLLVFNEPGVILRNIQSVFLPPELCTIGWYFDAKHLSITPPALYIPIFTVVGAAAVMRRNRSAWYTRLITVCAVFACIPLLNSVFTFLNGNYYTRWYLCPVLLLVMLTGIYIEHMEEYDVRLEFRVSLGIALLFVLYGAFVIPRIQIAENIRSWGYACGVSLLGFLLLWLMLHPEKTAKASLLRGFRRENLTKIVPVFCALVFFQNIYGLSLTSIGEFADHQILLTYNNGVPIKVEDDSFFRVMSSDEANGNIGLSAGYPNISQFNSTTLGTETEFFARAGLRRQQGSQMTGDDAALASLLSVKYDFYLNVPLTGGVEIEPEDVIRSHMYEAVGFHDYTVSGHIMCFRNDAFIPMGFTFDYYLPLSDFPIDTENGDPTREPDERIRRQRQMLKAIVFDDEQIARFGDILEPLPEELKNDISEETYFADCAARAASACEMFALRSDGFDAEITLPKDNLVFFSVPAQDGFTAYVDGQETPIESVFGGLSAVYVPQGRHSIAFEYSTPGLGAGIAVTAVSAGALVIYGAVVFVSRRRTRQTAEK